MIFKLNKSKYFARINALILLLCCFVVFSPVTSYISQNILHFPITVPELLFIPFYFKIRKEQSLPTGFF